MWMAIQLYEEKLLHDLFLWVCRTSKLKCKLFLQGHFIIILVSSKLSSACNIEACPKQFSVFMHTTMYSQQRPGVLTWLKLLLLLIRG